MTMAVQIRVLGAADVADFADLRLAAIADAPTAFWPTQDEEASLSSEALAARLQRSRYQAVFGAFAGDRLIGVAGLRREVLRQVRHRGTVWGVFVSPPWRGQGVARALLEAVIAHARGLGDVEQLQLYVNTTNEAARCLYRQLGFTVCGSVPRSMYVDGVYYDEDLMALRLDAPSE
jgi:RimJ/RimL family protein N-acetyltransferase